MFCVLSEVNELVLLVCSNLVLLPLSLCRSSFVSVSMNSFSYYTTFTCIIRYYYCDCPFVISHVYTVGYVGWDRTFSVLFGDVLVAVSVFAVGVVHSISLSLSGFLSKLSLLTTDFPQWYLNHAWQRTVQPDLSIHQHCALDLGCYLQFHWDSEIPVTHWRCWDSSLKTGYLQ